jgi:AraC-like DNA-binding protein
MLQKEYAPHPILANYIKCLWISTHEYQSPEEIWDVYPDTYIELTFNFGRNAQIHLGQSLHPLPRCCIIGLLSKPFGLHADGELRTVSARFFAWSLYPLLGLGRGKPREVAQQLDETWHGLADRIEQALQSSEESAITVLHDYLLELALQAEYSQEVVQAAIQRITSENGQVKISELADYCYVSRRQLERQFAISIGQSPKSYARLARFEQVRNRLFVEREVDLGKIAQEYGYADQAHLTRDFKRFSGQTPIQFTKVIQSTREFLSLKEVAIIQDK